MRPSPSGGAAQGGRSRAAVLVLVVGTLVLAALRLLLASKVDALTSLPDEYGFLGDAWALGHGGIDPPMAWSPFYPGGYPFLLTPVAALTDDPGTLEAWARALNVVLLAGVAPALWALLGRLGRIEALPRALVALAGAALPGLWIAGVIAWPDALAALLWPLTILAAGALARPGRARGRIWFGPAVALLWFAHARFLPVLVLGALVLGLRLVAPARGPGARSRGVDVANVVLGVAVVALAVAVNRHLAGRWDDIADGPLTGLGDDTLDAVGGIARAWVGQAWYLLAGTFGLAGIGLATLVRTAWTARTARRGLWTEPLPLMAATAAVGAVAVQIAGALQLRHAQGFGEGLAFDLVANGRYQEVVLAPLVAVGLARVVRRVTASVGLEAAVVGVAVVGAVVVDVAATSPPFRVDPATMADTSWGFDLWADAPTVVPTLALVVAVALVAVLRLAHIEHRAVAVPLAALLAFGVVGWDATTEVIDRSEAAAAAEPDLARVRARLDGASVAFPLDGASAQASFALGWELAAEGLVPYDAGGLRPPRNAVLAPVGPTGLPTIEGLEDAVLTTITGVHLGLSGPVGLWIRPGARLDALTEAGRVYPAAGEPVPLSALVAGLAPARDEIRVPEGSGPVPLEVVVTHAGEGTVWPDAPGHPAFGLVAVGEGTASSPVVGLGEVDPGGTVRRRLDLRPLAKALGPGRHTVELQVRLPDGQPLASRDGAVLVTLVVGPA